MRGLRNTVVALVVWTLAVLPVPGFVARDSRDPRVIDPPGARVRARRLDLAEAGPSAAAARAFVHGRGGLWSFWIDRRTARPTLVQGSGVPLIPGRGNALDAAAGTGLSTPGGRVTPRTLEPPCRAFLEAHPGLLLPPRGILELDREASSVRREGSLASLYFHWLVDGIPVDGAYVFVRVNSGNVTQFGAPLVGPVHLDTAPVLGPAEALARLMVHSGDGERYHLLRGPELRIRPEEAASGRLDHRLVWRIVYRVAGRIETWEGLVDAHDGEIVGFRDTNRYARTVGGVYPRTVFEENEMTVPLPFAEVTLDGTAAASDVAGAFAYAGGTAASGLDGQWVNTACQGCSNPAQPSVEVHLGTGRLDFGTGGADEVGNGTSTPADRNAFYHINQVRRVARKWLPFQTWFNSPITANVNIEDICNAVYNGAVNFFRSGGGCNNTGEIADVIYHEWGHGLDLHTLGGDGATGEGTADVVSMHVTHSALVGPGFAADGEPVRNLDPTGPRGPLSTTNVSTKCPAVGTRGPLGFEVHCEGEIYGQAAWDLAQALVAKHGYHTGWQTAERLFFTSLPDAGGYLASSAAPIYAALLNADDDDGNLANGTPNAAEIFAAFDAHGIAGPPVPASPECPRPPQPALSVTPHCEQFELSWEEVPGASYRILRGELTPQHALFRLSTVSSGQTTYTDTQVAPDMDYWYVVMAVDGRGCESTIENPVPARLTEQPVLSLVAATPDDTPRGNRSGFPDPGEEVDLRLVLANAGSVPATALGATITTDARHVSILDGQANWPVLATGEEAENLDVLRFRANEPHFACGDTVPFRLVPDEASGCAAETSYFEIGLGDMGVCDPTPACYVEPTFGGLDSAEPGSSCAEVVLTWQPASSNCENATIRYNVYRDLDPGFVPGPGNLVAGDLVASPFTDSLLQPGLGYHYIVRAFDSRSGEESNLLGREATAPVSPDIRAPEFAGAELAQSGAGCGEIELVWSAAQETCSLPVSFEIYRSADPDFVPGPATRIGSTFSGAFTDAALAPGADYTYLVRARDASGNEGGTPARVTANAGIVDRVVDSSSFEIDADGWQTASPNDADTGTWEWGDPAGAVAQPEDCADGTGCWVTGLAATLPDGSNNDVDNGTTTLISRRYDLTGTVEPLVAFERWFSNDQGAAPGEDPFLVEASDDDGTTWRAVESVSGGTPLAWERRELALSALLVPTDRVRFRFQASDLGQGSLVEAGVDQFEVLDRDRGCLDCALPVAPVGTILVGRSGEDVVLDWAADPAPGERFVVYRLTGPTLEASVRVGTTETRGFVHRGAAASAENFVYRVSVVDACGNESVLVP